MTASLNLQLTRKVWLSALPRGVSKVVLLCFCQHANDGTGLSWPSVVRVARMCGMSERTVQCHIRKLEQAGILVARLRTGRTTRYTIHLNSLGPLVFESETVVLADDLAKNNQPMDNFNNPAEIVNNSSITPATFAENMQGFAPQLAENDKKPVEICTLTINRTINEPKGTAVPALPASALMVDSVNPEVLARFAAIRKTKRKGPVTAEVIEEICRQAHLAGLTLEQALQHCCHADRKWARFEASWMQAKPSSSNAATVTTPAAGLWKPPVSQLAKPEIRIAELQRQRQICQTRPEPVAGMRLGRPGAGWAHAIVHKYQSGQPVSRTSLREACLVLKIMPASLSTTNTP